MIVVFAGAGASKATNLDMYPTTVEFLEKLPSDTTEDPLFGHILEFLQLKSGDDSVIDIEEVLWVLHELSGFVKDLNDRESILGWFFTAEKIMASVGMNFDLNPLLETAPVLMSDVEMLVDQINYQVYEYYAPLPSEEDLNRAWTPLLQHLLDTKEWIELFTTNYDQVIEAALQLLIEKGSTSEIHTGRVAAVRTYLDQSVWQKFQYDDYESREEGGLLTKLHGSVDWSKQGEVIYVGTPLFSGSHQRQVIIYPGFKGSPKNPPFDIFHNHLRDSLRMARAIIFIGFAFRDEYINQIIRDSVPENTKIITINPGGLPAQFPLDHKRAIDINGGFDLNSVNRILDELWLHL